MSYSKVSSELLKLNDKHKAKFLSRFFKTGPGEYAENDQFLGIPVPVQRKIAKKYLDLSQNDLIQMLHHPIHEFRLTGLMILTYQYQNADFQNKKLIYKFLVKNRCAMNNWDLVDVIVPKIIGDYLFHSPMERKILHRWSLSDNLWERRIAVLATFPMIRNNEFVEIIDLAERLLEDKEDLIHKAVGWMLREMGQRDIKKLESFIKKFNIHMPRTMLRYAIEKFSSEKRKIYLDFAKNHSSLN